MSNITIQEAQAWARKTKLDLGTTLDGALEEQTSTQVLARVAQAYDTSTWTTADDTPAMVRSIIAMMYVAVEYARTYAADDDRDNYSDWLLLRAEAMLANIVDGTTPIGVDPVNDMGTPSFYPNDASSAFPATLEDPSLGPAKFSMGEIW